MLKYWTFRDSISVEELSTFAETGVLKSRRINKLFCRYLTQPVKVNPVLLDRLLNSGVGTVLLDEISQAVHTSSGQADRQALRSTLIISTSGDRSLL